MYHSKKTFISTAIAMAAALSLPGVSLATDNHHSGQNGCDSLPSYHELRSALQAVAPDAATNGGLDLEM